MGGGGTRRAPDKSGCCLPFGTHRPDKTARWQQCLPWLCVGCVLRPQTKVSLCVRGRHSHEVIHSLKPQLPFCISICQSTMAKVVWQEVHQFVLFIELVAFTWIYWLCHCGFCHSLRLHPARTLCFPPGLYKPEENWERKKRGRILVHYF